MINEINKIMEQLSTENLSSLHRYAGFLLKDQNAKQEGSVQEEYVPENHSIYDSFQQRANDPNLRPEVKELVGILSKIPMFNHVDMNIAAKLYDIFNIPDATKTVPPGIFEAGYIYGIRAERKRRVARKVNGNVV